MSETNELTNLRAKNAQLREALAEQLEFTPGGPCQVPLIPRCCCGKCKLERAKDALSAPPNKAVEYIIAGYLEVAIRDMRKRTWVPGEDDKFMEMPDGSVPIWWLKQEIARLRSDEITTTPDLYYIENRRSVTGNYTLWWRVNGCGYTCNLNEAWRVPKAEAERICRCRPEEDFMWPCAEIDALAERHVDVQRMRAAECAR